MPTAQSDGAGDLRIADPALSAGTRINFRFNGAMQGALAGETIAAALAAVGAACLGHRRDGTPCGIFCGMGVCQECLVTVDGKPSLRACMTTVGEGMEVTAQRYAVALPDATAGGDVARTPATPVENPGEVEHRSAVLIVGAGPAGLSAARAAALCGAEVMLLDERAAAGGQFFKQIAKSHAILDPRGIDAQMRAGTELIAEVERLGVTILSEAVVWGAFGRDRIAVTIDGQAQFIAAQQLLLATGAYERGVPVPGWTLPGYMTTGAAQTLLRTYRVAPGRRVLVAGNGPLNFQVAAELVAAGVDVVALVEAAARPGWRHGADAMRAAASSPGLMRDGFRYLARLARAGVPVLHGHAVVAAAGKDRVRECTVARIDAEGNALPGSEVRYDVDTVCTGYGLMPSNELARALGCRHDLDPAVGTLRTVISDDGSTSVPGVYVVGDAIALGGAHAARCQGLIAGSAAALALGFTPSSALETERLGAARDLRRHRAFQAALWRLFAAPILRTQLVTPDTILCRCEGVTMATVAAAIRDGAQSPGAVKRRTRAGMGRCQGRYCESLIASLLPQGGAASRDETFRFAPRVPVKPVRLRDLL